MCNFLVDAAFRGELKCERWWTGELLDRSGELIALVRNGVIDFTLGNDFWPKRNLRELDATYAIEGNWQSEWQHMLAHPARAELCQTALASGGTVLELAAGPGGGNLSPLLHLNPDVRLVVNDLESRVLHRWQTFISGEMRVRNTLFVAFDAVDMPIRDASIACISSAGGLSNVRGDLGRLLRECARVLKPAGKVIAYELVISPETVRRLPEELQQLWSVNPWLVNRWEEQFATAGLRMVSRQVAETRRLDPVQHGLAIDASAYGVDVISEMHCIIAEKVEA